MSPQPKVVQDAVDRYYHLSNEAPSYYMWQILDKGREPLRRKLADLAGTSHETIAVNRNATEALATVTWGLTLNKGDEIIMTKQDYPNMIHAWKQKELRDGIKITWLNLALPIENEEEIVNTFVKATTLGAANPLPPTRTIPKCCSGLTSTIFRSLMEKPVSMRT